MVKPYLSMMFLAYLIKTDTLKEKGGSQDLNPWPLAPKTRDHP